MTRIRTRSDDSKKASIPSLERGEKALRSIFGAAIFIAWFCALGCATSSPFNQAFIELETPHFILTSSLSEEETFELARNLEFFHAGVLDAVGLAGELSAGGRSGMPRTKVLAFDDRSVGRPFAVRGEASQILDRADGMIWVFRAGRSFDERVSTEIRHQYAHQLIRDLSPSERPLWYAEGVAQMAGTVEEAAEGVRIGRMVPIHRARIQDWRRSTLAQKMSRSSVAEDSESQRRLFEAQAWAIAHTLRFDSNSPNAQGHSLDLYRRTLDEGGPRARDNARKALGLSDERLTERVYQHLDRKRIRVRLVKVEGWDASKLRAMPLPDAEARVRLASLALILERSGLAEEYFERALAVEPNNVAAKAGLAVVAAAEGRMSDLETFAAAADSAGGGGDVAQVDSQRTRLRLGRRLGEAYRVAAENSPAAGDRVRYLDQARTRFAEVLETVPGDVGARVEMGRLALIEVQEASLAAQEAGAARAMEWFDAAGVLRPGSLWIALWKGEANLMAGLSRGAAQEAKAVLSRTHAPELERAAKSLLERAQKSSR